MHVCIRLLTAVLRYCLGRVGVAVLRSKLQHLAMLCYLVFSARMANQDFYLYLRDTRQRCWLHQPQKGAEHHDHSKCVAISRSSGMYCICMRVQ